MDLFIQLVQKINTRAEKKVEGEFVKELKMVRGKEGMMLRVAEAALAEPGGTVRKVIFPVVGKKTLKALAAEAVANEARVQGAHPHGAAVVVLQPLAADALAAAVGAGAEV